MLTYHDLTLRNAGYITEELQAKIRTTRLLIAGCGIGSSFAEVAVRLGFEKLALVDGDTVAPHNLNRQNFTAEDIGTPKVQALAKRLRAINPAAEIKECNFCLNPDNARATIAEADLIFDTIDFLDLTGIVALHDECRRQKKPAITALSVGWGAGCIYFPVDSKYSFRALFGVQEEGSVENSSYVQLFATLLQRLGKFLDPDIVTVVSKALTVMQDGTPCPASQVAAGAFSVGALGGTLTVRIIAGLPVLSAPHFLMVDLPTALTMQGIDLSQ